MTTENTDFELTNENIENWKPAQFWEADPMQQNQRLCRIILWVNWEKKTVNVETEMNTNSTPCELYHGLAATFTIPEDTDFEEFAEHYKENVQPLVQKIGEKYESIWNGSNWIGRFDLEEDDGLYYYYSDIENALLDAPKHDLYYYFDIRDSFQQYNEIIGIMQHEKIDFLTADLDDDSVLDSIIDALDNDEVVLVNHSREDYRTELKLMQESLIDDAEEEAEEEH